MAIDDRIDLDFFDVKSYLDDKGYAYANPGDKNVSIGWIGINCPFCRDKSNHMGVNMSSMTISCWKCNKQGTVLALVMRLDSCSFHYAKDNILPKYLLREFAHLSAPKRKHSDKVKYPSGIVKELMPVHTKFIESRRYDPEYVQRKYDVVGVGPTMDDWKFRLIIPVYHNRELITYVGRDTTGKLEVPYRNCPIEKCITQAKESLYNLDFAGDTVILVEGIFDSWRIGDGAVCTFGTKYTDSQLLLLKGRKRVFVMFDGREDDDGEAIGYAHNLAADLSGIVSDIEVLELDSGDPDGLSDDDVWYLRKDLKL
jgi:DNA primase